MKLTSLLKKHGLKSLKIKTKYLDAEWCPTDCDQQAAWELYVELITRISSQPLALDAGDEKAALESIYCLFPITRDILRSKGRQCKEFTKISVIVLNQIVRPFTAKWHRESQLGSFSNPTKCKEFREEIKHIQKHLRLYTQLLASIAEVEDLTDLEI